MVILAKVMSIVFSMQIGAVLYVHQVPDLVSFVGVIVLVVLGQLLMKRSWRFTRWSKCRLFAAV